MANIELARKNLCTSCHSVERKIVGPAFSDVAKKYADQPQALETVIQNIRAGGAGKWGPVSMPAQAQLSQEDIKKLANWILKLPH
jgi:cytochrome c551/c552